MPKYITFIKKHKNSSNVSVGAGAQHLAPQHLT